MAATWVCSCDTVRLNAWNITSWRSHAKISKLWCWFCFLIKFFSDNLGYCTHGLQFYLRPMKPCLHLWLRCVMGICLFYSSIASTGNMHVKIQLLLVWEGPQPDAIICMLRMFLRMLNTVMWLYPVSAGQVACRGTGGQVMLAAYPSPCPSHHTTQPSNVTTSEPHSSADIIESFTSSCVLIFHLETLLHLCKHEFRMPCCDIQTLLDCTPASFACRRVNWFTYLLATCATGNELGAGLLFCYFYSHLK